VLHRLRTTLALGLGLSTSAFAVQRVAAQDYAFPSCAVASTESVGDLQPGAVYVVVSATQANAAKATGVCIALVNNGGYELLSAIPTPDDSSLNVAHTSWGTGAIDVLARIDSAGFADAPSDRTVLDIIRADAAAFDVQNAVPGVVMRRSRSSY